MPNEIKIGKLHYKREESGFWVAQFATDPMSATVTSGELAHMIRDSITSGEELIKKMQKRISELVTFVGELENERLSGK